MASGSQMKRELSALADCAAEEEQGDDSRGPRGDRAGADQVLELAEAED